jgi:hypothetical protein
MLIMGFCGAHMPVGCVWNPYVELCLGRVLLPTVTLLKPVAECVLHYDALSCWGC